MEGDHRIAMGAITGGRGGHEASISEDRGRRMQQCNECWTWHGAHGYEPYARSKAMKKGIAAVVVMSTLAAMAFAQDEGRRRGEGRRGDRWRRGPSLGPLVERLTERLALDDEQRAQIEEIVAAQEQRMEEHRAQWQEMREATEAGDEERAAELREQLMQQRGERGQAMEAILDQIEPLLHEDQLEQFQQIRERMPMGPGPGRRGQMRQIMSELPDAVNMTEEQRKEFEALVDEQRALMRERMQSRWQQRESEDGEDVRPRSRPDFGAMYDEFFEEVAQILNEDQLPLLSDYRNRVAEERRRHGRGSEGVRTVLSAVKRVRGLSSDQQDAVRKIERDAMQSSREMRRDREGLALLAARVKEQITDLLDEGQVEEFERNLERLSSRGRGGERGIRGRRDRERPRRDRPDDRP
jgi:soluble cytochrome b562